MDLKEKVEDIKQKLEQFQVSSKDELEQFRIKFLGSKNIIKDLYAELKSVPNEQKKDFGQLINSVKIAAERKYNALKGADGGESKSS